MENIDINIRVFIICFFLSIMHFDISILCRKLQHTLKKSNGIAIFEFAVNKV